jgi:GNAT superfamily N-acetyltransferase
LAGPTRTVTAFADRELDALYVLASHHGRGIGRALIEAAIIDARASAAAALGFWVVHGNTRARRFYEAVGAEAVAERKELLDGAEVVEVGYRLSV